MMILDHEAATRQCSGSGRMRQLLTLALCLKTLAIPAIRQRPARVYWLLDENAFAQFCKPAAADQLTIFPPTSIARWHGESRSAPSTLIGSVSRPRASHFTRRL
ncbi:hypothetical protein BOSEA1005_11564 [Hyphomicrobiales bacterium]|nr:hypothetical protein BOSEA1005_11564 [Hyphomicrobiales bacterium]